MNDSFAFWFLSSLFEAQFPAILFGLFILSLVMAYWAKDSEKQLARVVVGFFVTVMAILFWMFKGGL